MTEQLTTPAAGRKETPTARLVLSVDAPRAEWLAARREGITATDLVAIMGQSKYRSAFDIWCDKTMPAGEDTEAGEAAYWGTKLEEPVAQAWAERHNLKIRRVGLIASEVHPWALASLDRIVQGCPEGRCALEVKTRSLFVADSWEQELPADVRTQCLWQMLVSGLDHIHVAALIGGQRMVEHRVDFDLAEATSLVEAATLIWTAVQDGNPPTLPANLWTDDFLEKRHPERSGEVEVDADTLEVLSRYNDLGVAIKSLEDTKAALRTQLVGVLGDCDTATAEGKIVYSYKASERRSINSKAVVANYPAVKDDEACWTTSTSRTLRTTTKEGNK